MFKVKLKKPKKKVCHKFQECDMSKFDEPIERLIEYFRTLPSVGLKTAQRYAFSIIEAEKKQVENFASAMKEVKEKIHLCTECGNYTDGETCSICNSRDKKIICVVKNPKDIFAMEKIKNFNGVYHVLFGTISPLENRGPNDIKIKELLSRVQKNGVQEVVMATDPDVEGDATALYIAKLLQPLGVKVTRLAQGIAMGTDLEYADEVSLSRAYDSRIQL